MFDVTCFCHNPVCFGLNADSILNLFFESLASAYDRQKSAIAIIALAE